MAARRATLRYHDTAIRPAGRAMRPQVAPAGRSLPATAGMSPALRQTLARLIVRQVPDAISRQLAPVLFSRALAQRVGQHVAREMLRRDPPPALSSRPVEQQGPLGHEEWRAEEQETSALSYVPQSREPDTTWMAERVQSWAEEAAAAIRARLEAQATAADTGPRGR